MNRSFTTSRRAIPGRYSGPPLTTSFIESRFAPFSIGITNPASGLFVHDTDTRKIGWRAQAPNAGTPSVLWIYCYTTGAVGAPQEELTIKLLPGLASDPWQPDTTNGLTTTWVIPAAQAVGWISLPISQFAGFGVSGFGQTPIASGTVVHVVTERSAGTLSGGRSVSFPSIKSRFPLQHGYRVAASGESVRDDYSTMMYSSDTAAEPYVSQKIDNGSFHPIWFLEFSDAEGFGQPYDVIEERKVYGAAPLDLSVMTNERLDLNFMAINMRGSGGAADPLLPTDHLYLTIIDTNGVAIYGPEVFVNLTDRLFKSRPHWFGHQPPTVPLRAQNRYRFVFSSPGSADSYSTDSYLVTLVGSTLAESVFAGIDSYAALSGVALSPKRTFGFMLRNSTMAGSPHAVIDEFLGGATNAKAHAGATVTFNGLLSRNLGPLSDGITGVEIWAGLRDWTTGMPPPGYSGDQIITGPFGLTASLGHNNENTAASASLSFTMPATDAHLKIVTGHSPRAGDLRIVGGVVEGGVPVIDDWSPVEVRVY